VESDAEPDVEGIGEWGSLAGHDAGGWRTVCSELSLGCFKVEKRRQGSEWDRDGADGRSDNALKARLVGAWLVGARPPPTAAGARAPRGEACRRRCAPVGRRTWSGSEARCGPSPLDCGRTREHVQVCELGRAGLRPRAENEATAH
jgi:hypothetical protein